MIEAAGDAGSALLAVFKKFPAQNRHVLQELAGDLHDGCVFDDLNAEQAGAFEHRGFFAKKITLLQDINYFAAE